MSSLIELMCRASRPAVLMLVVMGIASGDSLSARAAEDHDVALVASDARHADTAAHAGATDVSSHVSDDTGILSFDIGSAFWNLVIFLAVLVILSKFVWPGILSGLQAREDKIHSDLVAAEAANAKAQSLLGDYQTKLNEASTQVQTMLADARRDAEANGQKIVAEAKAEAERQRERAVADIETAKKVAMADLAGSTADLAMNVARSVVGRELRAEDHADLVRQSLDRLPSNN